MASLPVLRMKIHWIFRVVSLFNYQGSLRSLSQATSLLYHIVFNLSSTFFKSFLSFFQCVLFFQTACLSYHNSFCLSSTFFKFFKLFELFELFELFLCFKQLRYLTISFVVCQLLFYFLFRKFYTSKWLLRESNPCYRRERAMS